MTDETPSCASQLVPVHQRRGAEAPRYKHQVLNWLRSRATSIAHTMDHAIARILPRRRVLVDVRTPMNLAVLAPVWRAMLVDRRLDVRFTGPDRDDLRRAFAASGVTNRVVARPRARAQRWDLYMNADPWEPASLWRCRRRVNFFHGVAGKYDLDCPTGLPLGLEGYDRVAFPNTGRLRRYVNAGIVAADRAALVGFPKLDALVNATESPRDAAVRLGLSAERQTALYAPTFSPQASLQEHGEAIVRHLLAGGLNVIVKLHDRSLDAEARYSGGHDWEARFAPFSEAGRFLFARSGDSTDYLLAADVMVTDHSTVGFEFCALDRPLIVFDVPELLVAARVNADKAALLRSAATVVSRAEELPAAVRSALGEPKRLAAARARAVAEVFFDPGHSTSRALAVCYELLDGPYRLRS